MSDFFSIFKQVLFGKVTTLENELRTCAREFLQIDESRYEEEVSMRNLDLFLLDGKARVTDETYSFNKTSFNFCYLKVRYGWHLNCTFFPWLPHHLESILGDLPT